MNKLLTFQQAAEIAGVSAKTIRRAASPEAYPRLKVVIFGSNTKRIRPAELDKWIQKKETR